MVSVEISGKQVLIRVHQRKTCPKVQAEGSAAKRFWVPLRVPLCPLWLILPLVLLCNDLVSRRLVTYDLVVIF